MFLRFIILQVHLGLPFFDVFTAQLPPFRWHRPEASPSFLSFNVNTSLQVSPFLLYLHIPLPIRPFCRFRASVASRVKANITDRMYIDVVFMLYTLLLSYTSIRTLKYSANSLLRQTESLTWLHVCISDLLTCSRVVNVLLTKYSKLQSSNLSSFLHSLFWKQTKETNYFHGERYLHNHISECQSFVLM